MRQPVADRVDSARPGDAGAADAAARFTALVESERVHVHRLVRRLLGAGGEVDDVLQDVFTRAWLNWDRVRQLDAPGAWLSRVAINACRARMRRQRLWRLWFRQTRPAAATRTDARDDPARVRAALAGLGHADREVLVLRYLEELSTDDVAGLLGLSRAAVDARLSRARRRLGDVLGDRHE